MEIGYMEPGVMDALPEGVLFYPCSGYDLREPITRFAPVVTEFWFVDMMYHFDVKSIDDTDTIQNLSDSARYILTQSRLHIALRILDISFRIPVATRRIGGTRRGRWSDPVDVICQCRHKKSGRDITVHLRRGCGLKCLEKHEFEQVSVLFYRGDSQSEGGSNNQWLKYSGVWFPQLVARMPDGSLLVTDGSNSGHRMGRHLCHVGRTTADADFEEDGHHYHLVGRVSDRYGPTCAWQYTNMASVSP